MTDCGSDPNRLRTDLVSTLAICFVTMEKENKGRSRKVTVFAGIHRFILVYAVKLCRSSISLYDLSINCGFI